MKYKKYEIITNIQSHFSHEVPKLKETVMYTVYKLS